jgi:hypothetical protein
LKLEDYKEWFVHDEGHWYVSKVKQYNPESVLQFSKGLRIIDEVINAPINSNISVRYFDFRPTEIQLSILEEQRIYINDYSILFICCLFLKEDLLDLSHLASTNDKKFRVFSKIQKDFIEGKVFSDFVEEYSLSYLKRELMIYYRNFRSWLSKFGFYTEYQNKTAFITDSGRVFLEGYEDIEAANAIFLNQVKKFQLWNPTIDEKYRDLKIRPYYLLLEILLALEDNYISKIEYVLFVTKIKSHLSLEIKEKLKLIEEFRSLQHDEQQDYVQSIKALDKKKYRRRSRTNYTRLMDSASKEIDCYGFGGLIQQGEGRFRGKYGLTDVIKAKNELDIFSSSGSFIEFNDKIAWVSHLGSLEGLSIEDIIEMYLDSGMDYETIKSSLGGGEVIVSSLEDKIYEKEIETFYVQNIHLIDPNLEVLERPAYGRQFSTHIGPIDILCRDKRTQEYVVCELKRGQSSDETVGQILRYMGWVYEHLAESSGHVRGILIASDFDKKLDYSLKGIQYPEIFELIHKFRHPFNDQNHPPLS